MAVLTTRVHMIRWPVITSLTLVIAAAPTALVWNTWQVDRDFHAAWRLLNQARMYAMQKAPVTVRFTRYRAVATDPTGAVIESNFLPTLAEVRYQTTGGDRRVMFGRGGATRPYNIYEHGGDMTFRSWAGSSRSIWIHCTGGITEGRNGDWTLNMK